MPVEIPLTRGYVALVDEADAESVMAHRWCAHTNRKTIYAVSHAAGKMHRFILGLDKSAPSVDHVDHNGLNNQRANLRLANRSLNAANGTYKGAASGFRGVYFDNRKLSRPWRASIQVAGVKKYRGMFATAEEAAHAYDCMAIEAFGEFALPNFPRAPK